MDELEYEYYMEASYRSSYGQAYLADGRNFFSDEDVCDVCGEDVTDDFTMFPM